jgi:hypothetical protein
MLTKAGLQMSSQTIPHRLPRVDYLVGGGGALVESMVYRTSAPLAYVPMYGSGQNPAGEGREHIVLLCTSSGTIGVVTC